MYVAIDVGGSGIRVAAAENLERLPDFTSMRAETSNSFEKDRDFILQSALALGDNTLDALGVGVTGDINAEKSMVIRSVNNPHWNNQPVVQLLSKRLHRPVFLDNDAVAGALGEAYYGGSQQDFAYIVWGTGIGGVLLRHHEDAGITVDNINQQWDTYFSDWHLACSGSAIAARHKMRAEQLPTEALADVFAAFSRYLRAFSRTVNIDNIVVGGGVASAFATEFATLSLNNDGTCKLSEFGDQAGIYGAFAIIRHALSNV